MGKGARNLKNHKKSQIVLAHQQNKMMMSCLFVSFVIAVNMYREHINRNSNNHDYAMVIKNVMMKVAIEDPEI